jgi:hypothetical protein
MLDWFRKRLSRTASAGPIASQPPGEPFPWPRGTTLTALDETLLALPRAILGPSEVIGSVIRGDDAMQINIPEEGDLLFLRLRPGMSVSLSRSCQACVVSDDGQPSRFQVSRSATGQDV